MLRLAPLPGAESSWQCLLSSLEALAAAATLNCDGQDAQALQAAQVCCVESILWWS
jgi:hypothetical protein